MYYSKRLMSLPATTMATGWPAYMDCFVANSSSTIAPGPAKMSSIAFFPGISEAVITLKTPGKA